MGLSYVLLLTFVALEFSSLALSAQWLDDFVSYYEIADQSDSILSRQRRSLTFGQEDSSIIHKLRAFNKTFILKLEPDVSSFSDDHAVELNGKKFAINLKSFLVSGKVVGHEHNSSVHGSLIDGRFEGEIRVGSVDYHVENAEKFSKHKTEQPVYSVVYRSSDFVDNGASPRLKRRRRSADGESEHLSTCGWSHEHIKSSMNEHQKASKVEFEHFHGRENGAFRYRREASLSNNPSNETFVLVTDQFAVPKVCGVFMQVDHLLYEKFYQETKSDYSAVANIMSYLNFVIKTTNNIYLNTNFSTADNSINYRNLQMAAVRTKIYQTESEFAQAFQVRPAEQITNLDPTNFLNLVSRNNYDLYCASFVFTLRDFANGVLGLAWIHYPDMVQRGGICDRYGMTRYGLQSLNAGIVTQVNYGELVSRLVSATTFAHELGHAFGAQHDNTAGEGQISDPACYPGGALGNYIMYSSANSGEKPNNQRFSYCSRDTIAKNLKQIVTSPLNCLKTSVQFCGNSIVDPGEECDCGFSDDCGPDSNCCGPADDRDPTARCKLRKKFVFNVTKIAECSLSNGACCDVRTCTFRSAESRYICRQQADCYKSALCQGNTAVCPRGLPEPDGKLCGDLTKMCRAGECAVSSCEAITDGPHRYTGCQMEKPNDASSNYNRSELCFLSCKSPTTGKCFSSASVNSSNFDRNFLEFLNKVNKGHAIQLMSGAPCDNDRGYCDVFRKCRPVNTESPLSRLTDILFSESSMDTLRSWIEAHWWAVLLIGLAVIGIMILFVKCCSVHTPSDNQRMQPARKLFQRGPGSFRPVLRNGPAHGRGHGHQRHHPHHDQHQPPHHHNHHSSVLTVSESLHSGANSPRDGHHHHATAVANGNDKAHNRKHQQPKKAASSVAPPKKGPQKTARPMSSPAHEPYSVTSPNIETLPRPMPPSSVASVPSSASSSTTAAVAPNHVEVSLAPAVGGEVITAETSAL